MESSDKAVILKSLLYPTSKSFRRKQNEKDLKEIFSLIMDESSDSSVGESDDEDEEWLGDLVEILSAMGDEEFKKYMSIERETVEYLLEIYSQSPVKTENTHGTAKHYRKTIYFYIWYLAHDDSFAKVNSLFNLSRKNYGKLFHRVSNWLVLNGGKFIKWPTCPAAENKEMPGLIGVLGSTSFKTILPRHKCYLNAKQEYSVYLQAVVDADNKFIDVSYGEPGSLTKKRVLQRSDLYSKVETDFDEFFPNGSFLLANADYQATDWIVPPFRDNGELTRQQINFNMIHSSNSVVLTNTFAMLKARFPGMKKVGDNPTAIPGVCVLHNICIMKNDIFYDFEPEVQEESEEVFVAEEDSTDSRRDKLFKYLEDCFMI